MSKHGGAVNFKGPRDVTLRLFRALAVGAACMLAGCIHYPPPARAPAALEPGRLAGVRVVLRDSTYVDLERVEVRSDTIFGRGLLPGSRSIRGPHAIPLAEVAHLFPARFSIVRTTAAIVATGLAAFSAYAVALSGALD